jgi:GT2 family glycosyltransferase
MAKVVSGGDWLVTYDILSVLCGGKGFDAPMTGQMVVEWDNQDNKLTPCQAYQRLLENSDSEILIYSHDDVTIHDPDWLARVLEPFTLPQVVTVGLGGALSLGHPDLYKKVYRLPDMARGGYRSNQTDYATHGEQETGSCRVAVCDAFFLAVRRDFLLKIGGWPVKHLTHHCLDLWLACEAVRHRKEVYMVGCSVLHSGGGTSTKEIYSKAAWKQGGTLETDHQLPHRWLYENYRDVLPITIK